MTEENDESDNDTDYLYEYLFNEDKINSEGIDRFLSEENYENYTSDEYVFYNDMSDDDSNDDISNYDCDDNTDYLFEYLINQDKINDKGITRFSSNENVSDDDSDADYLYEYLVNEDKTNNQWNNKSLLDSDKPEMVNKKKNQQEIDNKPNFYKKIFSCMCGIDCVIW